MHGRILDIRTFPIPGRQSAVHRFRCTVHCMFWRHILDRDRRRRSGRAFLPIGVSFEGDVFADGLRELHDCSCWKSSKNGKHENDVLKMRERAQG